jgi:MFS family permease
MDTRRFIGGRARLLPLGLAFTAMFASAPGQSIVIAVFVDEILAGTGLSRTAFSALYAAVTVVSATVSFALGHAADRIGLRAVWALVAAGLAAACLIESLAAGIVLAAVGLALLRSFGQGSFPLLGTLIVNHWYPRRRGAAMAIASFGLTAASVLLPPLVALLIDGLGWRGAYRVLALVLAGLTGTLTAGSAILLVSNAAVSYLAFAVIGFATGVWGVANGIVWARTYGVASLGRIQGLASVAAIAAAAAGPLPLAVSNAATGSYTAGLVFLLATAATALGAALAWRAPR